jgi:hypothetical protein
VKYESKIALYRVSYSDAPIRRGYLNSYLKCSQCPLSDLGALSGRFYRKFENKKKPIQPLGLYGLKNLAATYSPTLLRAVPSAMRGLTSEFEMGSGVTPSPMPPGKTLTRLAINSLSFKQRLNTFKLHKHTLGTFVFLE